MSGPDSATGTPSTKPVPEAAEAARQKQGKTTEVSPENASEALSKSVKRRRKKRTKTKRSPAKDADLPHKDQNEPLKKDRTPSYEEVTEVKSSKQKRTTSLDCLRKVPFERGFHFYTAIANYLGITAVSMAEFAAQIQVVPLRSIVFHFWRKDFQTWIRNILRDDTLADRLDKINVFDDLRAEIFKVVQTRLAELRNEWGIVPISEESKALVPVSEEPTPLVVASIPVASKTVVLKPTDSAEKPEVSANVLKLPEPALKEPVASGVTIVSTPSESNLLLDKNLELPPENKLIIREPVYSVNVLLLPQKEPHSVSPIIVPEPVLVPLSLPEMPENKIIVPEPVPPIKVLLLPQLRICESTKSHVPEPVSSLHVSLVSEKARKAFLPTPQENTDKLCFEGRNGVFFTPPGLALSQLFEQELGVSFIKTDFEFVQQNLPKLLVEDFKLAEKVELQKQANRIIVVITGSVLHSAYDDPVNQTRTHAQVGGLLTSALACVLAKATGKPIIVQTETHIPETKSTYIEYFVGEE